MLTATAAMTYCVSKRLGDPIFDVAIKRTRA